MAHAEPSPFKFGYYYDMDKDEADRNDPQLYPGELHMLLFGLNGAGKSTRILVENLVTIKNRSLVVIDVKGELAAQTARTRRTLSDVKIVNPYNEHGMGSDGYNPLTVLDPDDDTFFDKAKDITLAMIESATGNNKYFTQSAAGWFCGGIMWEVVQAKLEGRVPSLLRAREWCLQPDEYGPGPDGREVLVKGVRINAQRMVKQGSREIANLGGRFAHAELTKGDQEVLQTLNTETEFLISPAIARDLEKGEWSFGQLREKITTVYIVLPMNQLSDKRRWIRVIVTAALFAHLKPSPLKTLFVLDEFKASIGNLEIVNQFWALVRGYGVQFMPVCQSMLQLKELFKEEWESIAGQAGVVATIGPAGDLATAEWMAKRGGNTSIWTQGWNEGQGINPQHGGMPTSNMGETRSQMARAVLLPQEIMSMKEGTGLIWLAGEGERLFPYFAPPFWDRPALSGLIDDNPMRPGATSSPRAAGSPSSSSASLRETPPTPQRKGWKAAADRWLFATDPSGRLHKLLAVARATPGALPPTLETLEIYGSVIWWGSVVVAVVLGGIIGGRVDAQWYDQWLAPPVSLAKWVIGGGLILSIAFTVTVHLLVAAHNLYKAAKFVMRWFGNAARR